MLDHRVIRLRVLPSLPPSRNRSVPSIAGSCGIPIVPASASRPASSDFRCRTQIVAPVWRESATRPSAVCCFHRVHGGRAQSARPSREAEPSRQAGVAQGEIARINQVTVGEPSGGFPISDPAPRQPSLTAAEAAATDASSGRRRPGRRREASGADCASGSPAGRGVARCTGFQQRRIHIFRWPEVFACPSRQSQATSRLCEQSEVVPPMSGTFKQPSRWSLTRGFTSDHVIVADAWAQVAPAVQRFHCDQFENGSACISVAVKAAESPERKSAWLIWPEAGQIFVEAVGPQCSGTATQPCIWRCKDMSQISAMQWNSVDLIAAAMLDHRRMLDCERSGQNLPSLPA